MVSQVSCIVKRTFWEMTHSDESDKLASLTLLASPGLVFRNRFYSDSALQQLCNHCAEVECKADDVASCSSTIVDGSVSSVGESGSGAEHRDAGCSRSPEEAVLCWSAEMESKDLRHAEADRAPRQASSIVAPLRQ